MFSFIDFTPPLAGSTGYTNSSSQETLFPFDSISRRSTVNHHSTTPRQSEKQTSADPRDHSQLQKAWDLMLQKRFLVPCSTSVSLFYFQATYIVKAHPLLQVPLPPSSSARDNISLNFSHPSTCLLVLWCHPLRHPHRVNHPATIWTPRDLARSILGHRCTWRELCALLSVVRRTCGKHIMRCMAINR